jgi:hypothetical protein
MRRALARISESRFLSGVGNVKEAFWIAGGVALTTVGVVLAAVYLAAKLPTWILVLIALGVFWTVLNVVGALLRRRRGLPALGAIQVKAGDTAEAIITRSDYGLPSVRFNTNGPRTRSVPTDRRAYALRFIKPSVKKIRREDLPATFWHRRRWMKVLEVKQFNDDGFIVEEFTSGTDVHVEVYLEEA